MNQSNNARFQIVNGVSYKKEAPDAVVKTLEEARLNGVRVSILYGDPKTGTVWRKGEEACGYIGTGGPNKSPVLLAGKQALGGESVMDSSILTIKESKSGKILYTSTPEDVTLVEELFSSNIQENS